MVSRCVCVNVNGSVNPMCVFVISNTNMWAIHELIENETVIVDVAYKYM